MPLRWTRCPDFKSPFKLFNFKSNQIMFPCVCVWKFFPFFLALSVITIQLISILTEFSAFSTFSSFTCIYLILPYSETLHFSTFYFSILFLFAFLSSTEGFVASFVYCLDCKDRLGYMSKNDFTRLCLWGKTR